MLTIFSFTFVTFLCTYHGCLDTSLVKTFYLHDRSPNSDLTRRDAIHSQESLSKVGKLGLRLLEDLTALAAGGSVRAKSY